MSHAIATTRVVDGVTEVMKWCYNCGMYEWCREYKPHRFKCLTCKEDIEYSIEFGHYYIRKYGR